MKTLIKIFKFSYLFLLLFSFQSLYAYKGKVFLDKSKKPIAGAMVEVKNKNLGLGYYKLKTNEKGEFELKDFIPNLSYEIEIVAKGFVSYKSDFNPVTKKYYLEKESVLFGTVRDSNEKPIENVEITIEYEDYYSPKKFYKGKTDSKGNYKIPKLRPKSYLVEFKKTGFIRETANLQGLKSGENFKLPMVLSRPASFSGRLTISGLEGENPARNIQVALLGKNNHYANSFENGFYHIDDIKPGLYKLEYSHRGFEKIIEKDIMIKEGESITEKNKELKPLSPQASVFAYNYTFPVGDKIIFQMKSFRMESVKLKLYQIPITSFINPPLENEKLDPVAQKFSLVKEWIEPVPNYQPYEWKAGNLQINDALAVGTYCIEVESGDQKFHRKVFTVTSTGAIVKRSPNSLFIYVMDLITNAPIADARIFILKKNPDTAPRKKIDYDLDASFQKFDLPLQNLISQTIDPEKYFWDDQGFDYFQFITEWKTDKDGHVHLPFTGEDKLLVYALAPNGSYALVTSFQNTVPGSENLKALVYTDRPTYRLGHEVHFKVLAKEWKEKFLPLENKEIYYQIYSYSQGEMVHEGLGKLDEWGSFSGSFPIKESYRLGEYSIIVNGILPKSPKASLEDKKDQSLGLISLKEKNNSIAQKEQNSFVLDDEDDDDDDDNLSRPSTPENSKDTVESKYDLTQLGTGRFYVEQYRKPEFKIQITPSQSHYINGEEISFLVDAKYFFGAPLASANLYYSLSEMKKTYSESYIEEENYSGTYRFLKEGTLLLDENGMANIKWQGKNLPYDRNMKLEVSVTDRSNIQLEARSEVTVGRGEFFINLVPEEQFYSIGSPKNFKIEAKKFSGEGISTEVQVQFFKYIWKPWAKLYARDSKPFYEMKVLTDANGIYNLALDKEIRIPGEIDIVINAVDTRNNKISANRLVWIEDSSAEVLSQYKNLELILDKNSLKEPGEVSVLVKSKFNEIPIWITLEGRDIYEKKMITLQNNTKIVKFQIKDSFAPNLTISAMLQKNRGLFSAKQEFSLPYKDTELTIKVKPNKEKYKPGEEVHLLLDVPNKGQTNFSIGVVDESIYKIREDLTPSIKSFYYSPITNWVKTNTSFPITLLAGSGKDGDEESFLRKDFKDTAYWNPNLYTDSEGRVNVKFKLPDNLTSWRITVRGHDKQGRVGEAKEEIFCTKDLVVRLGKPRYFIEKDKIDLIGITTNNSEKGETDIQTELSIDGKKISAKDSRPISLTPKGSFTKLYEWSVPVDKENVKLKYVAKSSTGIDGIEHKVPIEVSGNPVSIYSRASTDSSLTSLSLNGTIPRSVEVEVYPNSITQVLSAVQKLSDYPYSCTEQTVSKIYPIFVLNKSLLKHGKKPLIDHEKMLSESIKKLESTMNYDRTWGFWYGGRGNEDLTGYVLEFLLEIGEKKISYEVHLSLLEILLNSPQAKDRDLRTYLTFLHALADPPNTLGMKFKENLSLKSKRGLYELTYLIRTMTLFQKNKAKDSEKSLNHEAFLDQSQLKKFIIELKSKAKRDQFGIYFEEGGSEIYSWKGNRIEQTALVLLSLLESEDYTIAHDLLHSLTARGKGGTWGSTKTDALVIRSIAKYIEIFGLPESNFGKVEIEIPGIGKKIFSIQEKNPAQRYTHSFTVPKSFGSKSVQMTLKSDLKKPIPVSLKVNGYLYPKEVENKKQDSFSITREFFRLKRVRDVNKLQYLVPERIGDSESLETGEEVLVKLKVESKENLDFIIMEDYLPSGFEISSEDAYENSGAYSHKERKDMTMMFFLDKIRKGEKKEMAYIMRAELSGSFQSRATKIECMYDSNRVGFGHRKVWNVVNEKEVERK